ncbi:hypothetical protein [Tenacibaculum sp. 190524A02b]|uniref:PGAP1-like alpha/beta domain-containing protein n=1 Tax=Tenacibaculum vairaonense TaxID=3137860 RepID=UPI0031FA556A
MKKLSTLLLCLLISKLVAQQLDADVATYSYESTTALEPLIKKDANVYRNSIFYDLVMPLAELNEIKTTNETNSDHFKRAWQEIYDARLTPNDKHMPLDLLKLMVDNSQNNGSIPIGLINVDFTHFTSSTLNDLENDRTTIEQLANQSFSARKASYTNKHLFLASPITNRGIYIPIGSSISFEIGTIGLNESSNQISSLEVNYNGSKKIIFQNGKLINTKFNYAFYRSGIKVFQFKATFKNGTVQTSNAKLNVTVHKILAQKGASNSPTIINATEPFKGYDEPNNCKGTCYGKGEYQTFYGTGNTKLRKPLIIIDGFDPGDLRKIDTGDKSIVDLINNNGKEQNLKAFRDAGFDVVILNFQNYAIQTKTYTIWHPFIFQYVTVTKKVMRDGGSDYIERNANVLKALITKLNNELQQNGSNEKIKIIGPSMGGLISRVALTQMEKNNQNHNADLWVSFDSPHQGANIPIGLQYFFNFMELDQVEMLKTPAARQMLITQIPPPFTLLEMEKKYGKGSFWYKLYEKLWHKYPGNYTYRNNFRNLLNSLGFPNQTRNVALVNGSGNGVRIGNPKGQMLDLRLTVLKTFLGSLGKYNIKTYASHDGGRHKIFERYKRVLFFKKRHTAYLVDNSGRGSLDNAPGGTFDMKNEFESSLGITLPLTNYNAGQAINTLLDIRDKPARFGVRLLTPLLLKALGSSVYLNLYQGAPSFIPTKSALAYRGSNRKWNEDLSNRNLVCSGETPFDSYFTPTHNEEHITLNKTNMAWVIEELKGNPQTPVFSTNLNYLNITGAPILCSTSSKTYKLSTPINSCSNTNVSWSVTDNIQIINSSFNSITVRAKDNLTTNVFGYITATVNGKRYEKGIWVGIPSEHFLNIRKIGDYNFYTGRWSTLLAFHLMPAIDFDYNSLFKYHWSVPNSAIRKGSNSKTIDIYPYNTGNLNVGVKLENECGCTDWHYQTFNISRYSSGGGGGGGILTPIDLKKKTE